MMICHQRSMDCSCSCRVCTLLTVVVFLFCYLQLTTAAEDLYALLGIKKTATISDIKSAYRRKAKETHPDKNLDKDAEVAAEEFRKVAHAFEVLSDKDARRHYDSTGSGNYHDQRSRQQQNQHQPPPQYYNFGFNFGFNQQRVHRYMHDPYTRRSILNSQSRIIRIQSFIHLTSIAATEEGILERYVLLAFITTASTCKHDLYNMLLYPWPFAGYNSWEGAEAIYWDEIMLVGLVVLDNQDSIDFAKQFSIQLNHQQCPAVILLNRGEPIETAMASVKPRYFSTNEDFSKFVWPVLQIEVVFINRSLWPLNVWWLDGSLGQKLTELAVGESFKQTTYLSHTFIFRPTFVDGNTLTNESSLLWFTATIGDDHSTIEVLPRCFDRSGECKRWAAEGFCKPEQRSFYVQQNPGHVPFVLANCLLSCKKQCAAVKVDPDESGAHPPHRYHSEEL